MPTLDWIGKQHVIAHHLEVPYRVLERRWSFDAAAGRQAAGGGDASGNMIIRGDNLHALKSLLPRYGGRVKCIYIDPPYNTGNEGWVYNDNVNAPQIRKWLGEVVGKEGEDLSRHDKWLCMMYPRLKLLHKLLAEDGVIFISIDDNELANLKLVCDEIFGAQNFVADIVWRKRTAKSDVPFGVSQDCEHILCYARTEQFRAGVKGKERKYYETPDFPGRPWRFHDLTKQTTIEERPNSNFTIINPKTREEYPVNPLRSWAITEETFQFYYQANRIIFPGDYDFLRISKPVLRYWKEDDVQKGGADYGIVSVSTHLPSDVVGMTQNGTKEITAIFGDKRFNFPKPASLVQYLIGMATITTPEALVLDSFAGSGTTAHAVLKQNAEDGGNRKFILVEMEDYAESLTAERVQRVIAGYGEGKNAVPGTGGAFSFYELGEPLLFADGNLNEAVGAARIREYIWYMETRQPALPPVAQGAATHPYLLGCCNGVAYWFYYEPHETALDFDFIAAMMQMPDAPTRHIVYADICSVNNECLKNHRIRFKKIPRDIARL